MCEHGGHEENSTEAEAFRIDFDNSLDLEMRNPIHMTGRNAKNGESGR